jgi:hypothetical protein
MSISPNPEVRSVSDIKRFLMQPALTSHYECYFPYPSGVERILNFNKLGNKSEITKNLIISCSDAVLPGSSLTTHELNNDFTGVTQRHAYRRLYDNQSDFSFYVDQKYTQIRLFEAWMRFIIGEQIEDAPNLNNSYRIAYPETYKTTIYITKFERNIGKPGKAPETSPKNGKSEKIVYSFFNSFPISISSIPVSYETSQLLKVTVSFSYDRYVVSNNSYSGSYAPVESLSSEVPTNPFESNPIQQANLNTIYSQNINLGNYSPGTFTNANFNATNVAQNFQQSTLTGINFG